MKTFEFAPGLNLRVVDQAGSPWFVAKDVCDALGMEPSASNGYASWLRGLDADEVTHTKFVWVGGGVHPQSRWLSESGLYSLILKSSKPEAKVFQKWVTAEVLPTIRKTGGYLTPAVANLAYTDPEEFMARALLMAKQKIEGLQELAKGVERACGYGGTGSCLEGLRL